MLRLTFRVVKHSHFSSFSAFDIFYVVYFLFTQKFILTVNFKVSNVVVFICIMIGFEILCVTNEESPYMSAIPLKAEVYMSEVIHLM